MNCSNSACGRASPEEHTAVVDAAELGAAALEHAGAVGVLISNSVR